MRYSDLRAYCDAAYSRYNRPEFISPDPLQLVLPYDSVADREIAGFLVAALSLGRVGGIIRAAKWILERLGSPRSALVNSSEDNIRSIAGPFVYRFFDGHQLAGLLIAIKRVVLEYGSLEACFAEGRTADRARAGSPEDPSVEPVVAGLGFLVDQLIAASNGALHRSIIIARPERGSACKRLFLFLRWMVRRDSVDPGGWTAVTPAQLLVPIDTHMLSICQSLGITKSRQATISVSRQVTEAFREFAPHDPVRYDFCLTRLGIHPDGRNSDLLHDIQGFNAHSHRTGHTSD